MPSKAVYDKMLNAGIRVDNCPYNQFDSVESQEDLEALFSVLTKFTDIQDNHPIITTNFVVANPDFRKIRASGLTKYYFEPFTNTYRRYPFSGDVIKLWDQGIAEKLVYPQYHGREHLNVNRWMKALQQNLPETKLAFDHNLFGFSTTITKERRRSYLSAFDFDDIIELEDHKKILAEGLEIFKKIFGFASESFIATNYTWHSSLEGTLADNGVKYIQGRFVQIEPSGSSHPPALKQHRLGRFNKFDQLYLTRNAYFEPSLESNIDPIAGCLKDISIAFRWKKPAIISSHRLNYIGRIVKKNRKYNLKLLEDLLNSITNRWKNVEFMNSVQLGAIIGSEVFSNGRT